MAGSRHNLALLKHPKFYDARSFTPLWRYQKFSSPSLVTTEGKEISIIRPGNPNAGGGPDFLEAQIFFDALLWNGPVEVHRKASDWYRHNHHLDSNY